MAIQVQCPACGGQSAFQTKTALVIICEYCHSVLARGDKGVTDLGKVAELAETASPLQLGLRGEINGEKFILVGRAQYRHSAGGTWDEWYAAFRRGTWGWLAEAQGRFYLTFEKPLPDPEHFPAWSELEVGGTLSLPEIGDFTINETGTAAAVAAAGEMPFLLKPEEPHTYIDLSNTDGRMATLDGSDSPPLLFVGREVTLAELGISGAARRTPSSAKTVSGVALNCPQCGGPLALHAPDQALRVTCPNCNALLDIDGTKLEYLKTLNPGPFSPVIPLGTTGAIGGVSYTVLGFVARSVEYDKKYYWSEYLLYEPGAGYRWLIESDGHWSFGTPINAGSFIDGFQTCDYQGETFRIFARTVGTVEYVLGEFYWKVSVGEQAKIRDYIAPPRMLSIELSYGNSQEAASSELNCTLSRHVDPQELRGIFPAVTDWPPPQGVGPIQPFPYRGIFPWWGIFTAALLVLFIVLAMRSHAHTVFTREFSLPPAEPGKTERQVFVEEEIDLLPRQNIRITGHASVNNSWVEVDGDLFNMETGLVQAFELPISWYTGVSEGERWTEGDTSPSQVLPALPAGKYKLRLEVQSEKPQEPLHLTVKIEQGVIRWLNPLLAFGVISIIPACVGIYRWTFETSRWRDSEFSPYPSGSSDDDSDSSDE